MAFTPAGMFYLSQKDLQPSMDAIGTGFRGMLGLQNKEEAVNEILQGADYDTPEGRRAALEQIRQIDPDAYHKYSKMNQDYETKELALIEAELDVNIKKNKPALEDKWLKTEEAAATSTWVKDNLSFYDIEDAPDKLKNPTSPSGITNLIIWLAKNDDNLESGKAGSLVSAYKEHMAATKKRYFDINAASFKPNTEVKQDRPLSSIKGRGNYVIPTPPSNVPTATYEEMPIGGA